MAEQKIIKRRVGVLESAKQPPVYSTLELPSFSGETSILDCHVSFGFRRPYLCIRLALGHNG